LTGDQQHRNDITNGQRVSRHSLPTLCFLFFPHRTFLKTILASRIPKAFGSTLGFAQLTSQSFAKPKSLSRFFVGKPFFSQRTDNNSYFALMSLNM